MVKRPTKSRRIEDKPFPRSTMETIDSALHKFVNETLDINCVTTTGFRKVPVIWSSAERVYQSKSDQRIRDKEGALVMPLITVERTGIVKDPSRKGTVFANIPPIDKVKGGSISVSRRLNQHKTSNFENARSKRRRGQLNFPGQSVKPVYETLTIPLPVYVTIQYEITLRSEYHEQMNQMLTPFITKPGGINYVIIEEGRLRYEAFVQEDFAQNNNIRNFSNEERKFETKVRIEVLGWLTGQDKNSLQPDYSIREGVVDVKIPRERVALADELDTANGRLYGLEGIKPSARVRRTKRSDDQVSTFGQTSVPGLPAAGASTGTGSGAKGDDGVSVSNVTLNDSYELIITLSDDTVFNLGNVRGATGATPSLDVISGSSATYHTMSGSTATFNLTDTDRIEANDILGSGGVTLSGLATGTPVSGKFLALDASNDVILTSVTTNTDIISGSTLTYHNMSGSTFTSNLLDSDRATINDVDFNSISGSTGIIHNLSSSAATFNLMDADRVEANDITGAGSVTLTGLDAGTPASGKHLALDASNKVILTTGGGILLTDYLVNTEFQESPNGVRTTFTVAVAFVEGTQQVFRGGLYMSPGASNDYTVTNTTTIEFTEAPATGENLRITYVKS